MVYGARLGCRRFPRALPRGGTTSLASCIILAPADHCRVKANGTTVKEVGCSSATMAACSVCFY